MANSQDPPNMTIEDILFGFEFFDGEYKRLYVDAALQQKAAITPHLLEILDRLLANPDVDPDYYAQFYAVMLLAHFREPQAHQRIVDIFSLPEDIVDPMFGDMITEDLPALLANTYDGSLDGIKRLALNQAAYDYCRGSAVRAIVYVVIDGAIAREEALTFLGTLLQDGQKDDPISIFYDEVAIAIHDLYPEELMDVVTAAYERGLIGDDFIRIDSFHQSLKKGKDACLQETQQQIAHRRMTDIHDSMAWWSCFQPQAKTPPSTASLSNLFPRQPKPVIPSQPKPKAKKKKAFWEL